MSIGFANLKRLEKGLLIVGLVLVGFAAITYLGGRLYSRMAVAKFHAEAESRPSESRPGDAPRRELNSVFPVDYSLWSPKRVKEYEATLSQHFDEPLALLRIDKIRLEVPVFEGTDDRILDRGVGRIEGTAHVGESGNVGIAGHRDGFFRGLKDISTGDTMVLETATGTQNYVIDTIKLVTPEDVSVLKSEPTPALTLVTCYPFYFIGSAPQRYIVHASLKGETKP